MNFFKGIDHFARGFAVAFHNVASAHLLQLGGDSECFLIILAHAYGAVVRHDDGFAVRALDGGNDPFAQLSGAWQAVSGHWDVVADDRRALRRNIVDIKAQRADNAGVYLMRMDDKVDFRSELIGGGMDALFR